MSYRAGTRGLLAWNPLLPDDDAHIYCDHCGVKKYAVNPSTGRPWAWLLNHRAPRGWKLFRPTPYTREDYCPECTKKKPLYSCRY